MNKITDDIEKLATECTNKLQDLTGYNYVIKPSTKGIIQLDIYESLDNNDDLYLANITYKSRHDLYDRLVIFKNSLDILNLITDNNTRQAVECYLFNIFNTY
ncbi:MAG: hypothetical protein VZQ62_03835 [Methanosphaera sp.]|nr:hypothetical protein [Methanosphaera sp.]